MNTAIRALSRTPSARKGRACTKMPLNTVPAVDRAALSYTTARTVPPMRAKPTIVTTTSGIDTARVEPASLIASTPGPGMPRRTC
jgi:hypothetical protein